MKLLLDSCVWGKAVPDLETAGHDVVWAGSWAEDPGDDEILRRAHTEGRVLVTLDKDFGEMAVFHSVPHSGILRLVNVGARRQAEVIRHVLQVHASELERGAVITADLGRLRIRLSDSSADDESKDEDSSV